MPACARRSPSSSSRWCSSWPPSRRTCRRRTPPRSPPSRQRLRDPPRRRPSSLLAVSAVPGSTPQGGTGGTLPESQVRSNIDRTWLSGSVPPVPPCGVLPGTALTASRLLGRLRGGSRRRCLLGGLRGGVLLRHVLLEGGHELHHLLELLGLLLAQAGIGGHRRERQHAG